MKHTRALRDRFLSRLPAKHLLSLFDLLPEVSFFLKDAKGRFVALNRRACDYCGVANEDEAIGKTDLDFFPVDRAEVYREDDRTVMESGEAIINRLEPSPESIRSPRLVVTSKLPLNDRRGTVIGLAGFSRRVEEFRDQPGNIARFARVVDSLHRNYAERLANEDLARQAGLSTSQFKRRFQMAFGTSPHRYLMRVRVEAAARMLLNSDETVAAIAQECGFHDHAHLSRSFQRLMHCSPSEYRARRRGSG